jgi:hypothetical protein
MPKTVQLAVFASLPNYTRRLRRSAIEFDRPARARVTKACDHVAMTGVATGSEWTGAVGGGGLVVRIVGGTSLGTPWPIHRDWTRRYESGPAPTIISSVSVRSLPASAAIA